MIAKCDGEEFAMLLSDGCCWIRTWPCRLTADALVISLKAMMLGWCANS